MDERAIISTTSQIWADMMEGNRRFAAGTPQFRELVREREAVAPSQHPKAMVLACADSRVAPEIMFDQRLGDLFVIRSAGSVTDKVVLGSLEFGAEHVAIPLLVVMGHQHCAAVNAACSQRKVRSANMKAVIRAVRSSWGLECFDGAAGDALCQAEKQNARHVARTLADRSDVLCARVQRGELVIIAAYYRLDTGVVERL